MNQITVASDCDGTLIDFFTKKPRYEIIALFHAFQKRGCRMYIWSHGGIEHAKECRDRLGLRAEVVEKGSFTPDIAIDDEERHLGRVNIPA
jgi:predicted HAD superfamily phosphohydrolase YqeG